MTEQTKPIRFNYAVEYIIFVPGQGVKASTVLQDHDIHPNRICNDYIGIIDQFYILNALRTLPYRFVDAKVRNVKITDDTSNQRMVFSIVRPLDECEEEDLHDVIEKIPPMEEYTGHPKEKQFTILQKINASLEVLSAKGFTIGVHGWYKVRFQC